MGHQGRHRSRERAAQAQAQEQEQQGLGGDASDNSADDGGDMAPRSLNMDLDLNNLNTSSVFLHTIPEGSSDIGASASAFNPAALAAAAAASPSGSTNSLGGASVVSPWSLMMKPFRSSALQNSPGGSAGSRPDPPPSVASSTRAVEAGSAGVDVSGSLRGMLSTGGGGGDGGMDGSNTAVRAGQEEDNRGGPLPGGGALVTDPKPRPSRRRRPSLRDVGKKKLGVVCLLAALLVIVVIVALILIIGTLGRGSDDTATTPTEIPEGGSVSSFALPSVAPSAAESTWGDDSLARDDNFLNDDFLNDDDLGDGATVGTDEENSVLVLLDEAIYRLYNDLLPSLSGDVHSNTDNARYQARDWLLNTDTLLHFTLSSTSTNTDTESSVMEKRQTLERIAQRYIMLVFYFSTLDDSDDDGNDNGGSNLRRRLPDTYGAVFEIYPDVHECYWIENACGQDDNTDSSEGSSSITTSSPTSLVEDNSPIVYLNVSFADLGGTLPFELGYLTKLRELTIQGNNIKGTIPEELFEQLKFLYGLDLSENELDGMLPSSLWTLPALRFAYLHSNRFSGTIPSELSSAPSEDLEEIWLQNNQLSGQIPLWWTELQNLEVLSVSNNAWTGQLPTDWSKATKLAFLDASVNQLAGSVPYSLLYSVPKLRFLYLDNNQLTGSLMTSTELQQQPDFTVVLNQSRDYMQLEALWLQNNRLSGAIPRGFGWEWNRLRQLELQGNQLTGIWECVEDESNVWPQLEELSVDCFEGSSLSSSPITATESVGGGVDMGLCTACCIKCF